MPSVVKIKLERWVEVMSGVIGHVKRLGGTPWAVERHWRLSARVGVVRLCFRKIAVVTGWRREWTEHGWAVLVMSLKVPKPPSLIPKKILLPNLCSFS